MNTTFVSDTKIFNELGCYPLSLYRLDDIRIPTKLEYGKTYYKEKNGVLVAFRIYASAIIDGKYAPACAGYKDCMGTRWSKIVYYVQYADMNEPIWEVATIDSDCKVFESKEHYLRYVSGSCKSVKFYFVDLHIELHNVAGYYYREYSTSQCDLELKRTFVWDKRENKPIPFTSLIEYLLITNDGIIINIDYNYSRNFLGERVNGFATAEECMKHHLNGMVVKDFGEDTIKINIEMKVSKPVTSTLQVIEF